MKQMRKLNRRIDAQWALQVFDKEQYITLSMIRPDGTSYAMPLNMVRKGDSTFYFHCAF